MKILTKEWVQRHKQLKLIHALKEFDVKKMTYENVKSKSKKEFYDNIAKDEELAKLCYKTDLAEKLYQEKVKRDNKTLLSMPKEIFNNIKDEQSVVLGYVGKEDKLLLTSYADKLLKVVEREVEESRKLTEFAEDCLPNEFIVDEIVGELVYEEYCKEKDYFLNIGGLLICIEDYKIIEREDYNIKEWEEDNPLSLWTAIYCAELHYLSEKCYELHLLLVDGDKYANEKYWYFTIKGSNVKHVIDCE